MKSQEIEQFLKLLLITSFIFIYPKAKFYFLCVNIYKHWNPEKQMKRMPQKSWSIR